jgi:hypothetical protein
MFTYAKNNRENGIEICYLMVSFLFLCSKLNSVAILTWEKNIFFAGLKILIIKKILEN